VGNLPVLAAKHCLHATQKNGSKEPALLSRSQPFSTFFSRFRLLFLVSSKTLSDVVLPPFNLDVKGTYIAIKKTAYYIFAEPHFLLLNVGISIMVHYFFKLISVNDITDYLSSSYDS
jgi:hypothetical protein